MLPMLSTSTSATRPRTITVSTSSCRYSGWGTWFRTDSTWTANLISPAVIYMENRIKHTSTHTLNPALAAGARCYLSCGWRRQHISIDGETVTLLQDLPDLLVETHWYSVDSSIQPASPQPLALPLLPVQLPISWTRAHWGQDPTGGGGAAATLWWEQQDTVRTHLINRPLHWFSTLSPCTFNVFLTVYTPLHLSVASVPHSYHHRMSRISKLHISVHFTDILLEAASSSRLKKTTPSHLKPTLPTVQHDWHQLCLRFGCVNASTG